MLLFAASTSRQLRAVSEGPRRKGKGAKDYYTWLEAKYSKAFYVGESRASGGRQDLEFEASVAVYVNRPHYAKFLDVILQRFFARNSFGSWSSQHRFDSGSCAAAGNSA